MRSDLKKAVALVRQGKTYREAGLLLDLTRNQVAGACARDGLKVGHERAKPGAADQLRRQRQDPYFEHKRLQALRASLAERRRALMFGLTPGARAERRELG